MSVKSISQTLSDLEPIKTLLWSIVIGACVASTAWAGVNNRINTNTQDISQVRQELKDEINDRKASLAEWRSWREGTTKQLGRIEGTNEAILRELRK